MYNSVRKFTRKIRMKIVGQNKPWTF